MKKLTILFLFLSSIVFAKPEWNGSYSVITSTMYGTFVHQVEYSNYVSVNSSNTGTAQVDFLTSSVNVNNIAIGLIQTSVNVNNIQIGILGTSVTAVNNYQVVTASNTQQIIDNTKWITLFSTNSAQINSNTNWIIVNSSNEARWDTLSNYQVVTATNSIELDFQKSTTTVLNNFVLVTSSNSAQINKLTNFMVVNDTTVVQVETNRQGIISANNLIMSTMTTMTAVFRATSTILNDRVTILENAAPAGGGSVKGSTGCITITGGSFDIPSLNGAINFNDEYDISGTSFCFGITKFHESTINYAIKRIIIPDFVDASLPINVYVTWNTTNTAVGFSSNAVVLWNLDLSTTTNSRGHVFTTYGATTSANVSLPYENVDSVITFTNTEIKRNAPILLRLYRTASSAFDNLAAFADVQSCQIYYQRLY